MKVITFSRFFPANHPCKGQPTNFVEKLWEAWEYEEGGYNIEASKLPIEGLNFSRHEYSPKYHTIRAGKRWIVGEFFSPRVWSGKPYASKQIEIASPIQIKNIWEIEIEGYMIWINKENKNQLKLGQFGYELAKNDGLTLQEFWDWFPYQRGKRFCGQVLCWNEKIEY